MQDFSSFVPRQAGEGKDRSQDNEERSQVVQKMVGILQADDFLGQDFQHVGRNLQQSAFSSYTVRTDTALESRTDFTLHIDKDDGQYGVHDEDEHADHEAFKGKCQPLGHQAAQKGMNLHEQRAEIIII